MDSFAERQLAKYGWKKGQGLGKNEDGIVKAVAVDKKNDTVGIGAKNGGNDAWGFQWWDHVFNKAASNIQVESTGANTRTGNNQGHEEEQGHVSDSAASDSSSDSTTAITFTRKHKLDRADIVTTSRPTAATASAPPVFGTFVRSSSAHSSNDATTVTDDAFHARDFSQAMSDAQWQEACEGRTGHCAARTGDGAGMVGKLKRAMSGVVVVRASGASPEDVLQPLKEKTKRKEKTERKEKTKRKDKTDQTKRMRSVEMTEQNSVQARMDKKQEKLARRQARAARRLMRAEKRAAKAERRSAKMERRKAKADIQRK